jgi:peptidyl-prolyl cis-trans isomerase A (cyclophilin A)
MARLAPGTASSEFFFCIEDQPELDFGGRRNPDGQGFAAFGRVVSGMDVVRAIQVLPTRPRPADGEDFDGQQLLEPVRIERVALDPGP